MMQEREHKPGFWQARWLRVTVSFLAGAVIFAAIVTILWIASFYSRFILPFDLLFQSPVILSFPDALIPLVFYDMLALPPVLILAIIASWAFGRYLRREKEMHLALCVLIGMLTVPLSFLIVSAFGLVMSGSAADGATFAILAPLPPSFFLGFLLGWKLGRFLYTKWTARLSSG